MKICVNAEAQDLDSLLESSPRNPYISIINEKGIIWRHAPLRTFVDISVIFLPFFFLPLAFIAT